MLDQGIKAGQLMGVLESGAAGGAGQVKVQSSTQLPGGLVQLVMNDGTVKVVTPSEADAMQVMAAEERGASLQGARAQERETGKDAAKTANEAFVKVNSLRANNESLKEVARLAAEGGDTGPIAKRLPSFRKQSIELDNMKNRLGLDVIGSVTFGALSEGELRLALDTALPPLNDPDLIDWANRKIVAQEKLADYFQEQAIFLSKQGNKQADWLKYKQAQTSQTPAGQPATAAQPAPAGQPQVIRFDAQGNIIQ